MSITAEREEGIDFTQNYFPKAASAHVTLTADADLKAGNVSAQVSTIQAGYVAKSGATLMKFATPDEAMSAMAPCRRCQSRSWRRRKALA